MASIKPLALLLAAASLTSACAELQPDVLAQKNASLYSIHQPLVQRADYVFDVQSTGNGLAGSEAERLRAWFETLGIGYGDRISTDAGTAYSDPAARQDVARIAADYGLLLSNDTPVTVGAIQPGAFRVVVSRMQASVPGCPDWSYAKLSGAPVTANSNYGCATNSNLAAMVADPNDLVLGQAGASATNSDASNKAINSYRTRIPSGQTGTVKPEKVGSQ